MPQLRPDADQTVGNWTDEGGATSNLFQSIDEVTASDADYVQSEANPNNSSYLVRLSDPGGTVSTASPITIRYRYEKEGNSTVDLTVELVENATTPVTRASTTHLGIGTAVVSGAITLSTAEKSAVSDWSDLYLRFTADTTGQFPDTVVVLEDGPAVILESGQEVSLEDGISLTGALSGTPTPTALNFTLSSAVNGTLYWVLTATATPPDLGSSGFETTGTRSGSAKVTTGSGTDVIDLSGVATGTWYLHSVAQRTSDRYYTTRYTNTITI